MQLLVQKRNQYEYAFRLLVADFLRVCEYIEPVDEHLTAYSHRLYEILLRSCTEFESICKEVLTSEDNPKTGNLNIADYVLVEPKLQLTRQVVTVNIWRPAPISLTPFSTWTKKEPSLKWYQGYNAVKHNRNLGFSHASLRNVRDSLASLFVILARLNIIENDNRHNVEPGSAWQGTYTFDGLPFGLQYDTQSSIKE